MPRLKRVSASSASSVSRHQPALIGGDGLAVAAQAVVDHAEIVEQSGVFGVEAQGRLVACGSAAVLLLAGVDHAEVVVGFGVVGLYLHGFGIGRYGGGSARPLSSISIFANHMLLSPR